jgi:hypothetical protein
MGNLRLRIELRALRHAINELQVAIEKCSEATHSAQKTGNEDDALPKPIPVKVSYSEQSDAGQDRQNTTQEKIAKWTKGAVFAAIFYATIATWQACEMRNSTEVNRAALVATQRAYIGVTGLNIERSQYNPKLVTYFVSPVIVNTGNTPTKNLWYTAVWGAVPTSVQDEKTVQDISVATQNYGTIAAHQEIRDLIKQPIPTEYADILRASNSQKHISIYGAIVYEDGISDPPVTHIRRYCYSMYVNPYFTPPDSFSYVTCGGRSNCEDEECGPETRQQLRKMATRPN